jgi:hypothetical protein
VFIDPLLGNNYHTAVVYCPLFEVKNTDAIYAGFQGMTPYIGWQPVTHGLSEVNVPPIDVARVHAK